MAVKAAGGEDDGSDGSGTGVSMPFYSVMMMPLPGIDLTSCGRAVTWTSQNVTPDRSGHFDTTWSPNEPNTLRVVGTVTDTTFDASLSCVTGNGSGSMAATGSGGTYQGTFSFNAQRGSITVVRSRQ